MNIALLADRLDPSRGGADRCILSDARALAARGHSVRVLTGPGAPPIPVAGGNDLRTILRVPRWGRARRVRGFVDAAEAWRVAHPEAVSVSFAPCRGADVYFPHGGCWQAWRRAEELSFMDPARGAAHGRAIDANARQTLFRDMEAALFRGARPPLLVALSPRVRDDFASAYGADPSRAVLFPNARVDTPPARGLRGDVRARWGVPRDGTVVLFAAHNFRLKGLFALVRAAAGIPADLRDGLTFAVVGKDPAGPYLREARRLGCDALLRFLGPMSSLFEAFVASDFLCQPTFHDPYSLTTLEALGAGLPVLTTRANGAADAVETTGGGWVVESAADTDALTASLVQALDPAERAWRARAGASTSGPPRAEERLERLESVLGAGGNPSRG